MTLRSFHVFHILYYLGRAASSTFLQNRVSRIKEMEQNAAQLQAKLHAVPVPKDGKWFSGKVGSVYIKEPDGGI